MRSSEINSTSPQDPLESSQPAALDSRPIRRSTRRALLLSAESSAFVMRCWIVGVPLCCVVVWLETLAAKWPHRSTNSAERLFASMIGEVRQIPFGGALILVGGCVLLAMLAPVLTRALALKRANTMTRWSAARWRRHRRNARGSDIWAIVLGACGVFAVMLILISLTEQSWLPLAAFMIISFHLLGAALAVSGLFARRGHRVVCSRCNFQMGTWRGSGDHCPECHGTWKSDWGSRLGEPIVRWRRVALGASMLVAGASIAFLLSW